MTSGAIGVGFGTAALGSLCHDVVLLALKAGFRKFDTAEENQWWYNQKAVGTALREFFNFGTTNDKNKNDYDSIITDDECVMVVDEYEGEDGNGGEPICGGASASASASTVMKSCLDLRISTKIPPWELTSSDHIRSNALNSREELVGFCDQFIKTSNDIQQPPRASHRNEMLITGTSTDIEGSNKKKMFPLDVYYIHAPTCWKGWHTRCDDPPPLLDLRSAWMALEAVVGLDHAASRIGLSNVRPYELLDIIQFVRAREMSLHHGENENENHNNNNSRSVAPPRIPDVVQSFADPIEPAEELRKICRENGIEFVSYSTLGTQHKSTSENPVLTSAIVQTLAAKHGRSTAEVVLSWALQHGMSVIPRSGKREHINELARLLPGKGETAPAASAGFLDANDLSQMELLKYSI